MTDKHNALAALAKRLKGKIELHAYYSETERQDDIKAQRIVAELANVTADYKCDPWQEFSIQAKYAVLRCRAIAEEGAEDGK